MAGITAQSATKTHAAGSTSADLSISGYVTKEQISLGVTGTPTTCQWSLSKPSNSGLGSGLDTPNQLTCKFTPDVDGLYTVSCLVDGATTYVLRIAALNVANISFLSAIHLLPCADSQVPVPRSGIMLYFSSETNMLSIKKSDGSIDEVQTL